MHHNKLCAIRYIISSVCLSIFSSSTYAAEYFDPNMLKIGDGDSRVYNNEDLSLFNEIDSLPGDYQLDLFINNNKIEHRKMYLYAAKNAQGQQQLTPCFQPEELPHYGLNLPGPVTTIQVENGKSCVDLTSLQYAKSNLNLNKAQLLLQVPQAYLITERLNFFERQYWDNGIPAFRLDYNISQFTNRQEGKTENSTFANLRSSANLGAWRFNQNSTWSRNSEGNDHWETLNTTLGRNLPSINSEIIFGDNYSSSALFESVKLRGATLQSDRMMQPRHTNTYAPGISGIADSESVVTITQNNSVIYKKAVTAGPFYLTDYYPLSNGGNLMVEITGLDGQVKRQIVPFSSLAFLERKDNYSYNVSMGQYHRSGINSNEFINQAEVIYGLTDFITIAGGSQLSKHYQAFSFGGGFNLGQFGAASVNMIHANSEFDGNLIQGTSRSNSSSGNAFKLNYNKTFTPTNTALTFAGYKFFSSGYYSLNDVMDYNDGLDTSNGADVIVDLSNKLKYQFDVALNQTLPNYWGSLNLNMSFYNYQDKKDFQSYNLGYSLSRNNINYGLYYNYYNNPTQDDIRGKYNISFNVSMPLFFSKKMPSTYASYNISHNDNNTNQTLQVSGLAGARSQATWNVYQGYDDKNYGGLSGSYKAPFATFNAGYSYRANDQQQFNASMNGSFVATQYGALFSQPLQATNALVVAKDVPGLKVNNNQATTTNKAGLAVIPGLSPYRKNQISLDTQTIPENAEIEETIMNRIIPTRGALVLADFKAKHGYKMLMTLQNDQLGDIPMGAKISLSTGETAMVANFNQAYVLTGQPKGDFKVDWVKDNQAKNCTVQFDLNNLQPVNGLYILKSNCLTQPAH